MCGMSREDRCSTHPNNISASQGLQEDNFIDVSVYEGPPAFIPISMLFQGGRKWWQGKALFHTS